MSVAPPAPAETDGGAPSPSGGRADGTPPRSDRALHRSFFLRRLLILPFSLFLVLAISFLLVALLPESTAEQIAGVGASPERVAEVRADLGIDRPLLEQFGSYVGGLLQGDLGTSFYNNESVLGQMIDRLPATLELVVPGFAAALLIGIGTGTLAAYFARRAPDRFVQWLTTATQSVPEFVLALLAIYFLTYKLGWLPAPIGRLDFNGVPPPDVTGLYTVDAVLAGQWGTFRDAVLHLVLPVLTIGVSLAVLFSRVTRASMGDALQGSHIEYARSLGLPEHQVLRYAFIESRTPLLTFAAICAALLVGGSAIVESIFSFQGLGQWGLESVTTLDPPNVRGYVLLTATVTLVAFFLLDLVSARLDPRITFGKGRG
ncbi:MAG TPA: ABC transporter permease [Mycobacteriales bacterium]|jgi:peptide/nickel transport system permease protein|nr:ABC transporter permease [Mycobacteriales bacterium]